MFRSYFCLFVRSVLGSNMLFLPIFAGTRVSLFLLYYEKRVSLLVNFFSEGHTKSLKSYRLKIFVCSTVSTNLNQILSDTPGSLIDSRTSLSSGADFFNQFFLAKINLKIKLVPEAWVSLYQTQVFKRKWRYVLLRNISMNKIE